MLTQNELKRLLEYDPESGIFTRRVSRGGMKAGSVAGCLRPYGYTSIRVGGKDYQSHRLAFLYMEGYMPENEIDHINRDPGDNRWSNLREVSRQCNIRNASVHSANKSRVKGVCWDRSRNKWMAQVMVDGINHCLGRFNDLAEAAAHRFAAEQCAGFSYCDTNSSAGAYLRL